MDNALESFISTCDEMLIAEESFGSDIAGKISTRISQIIENFKNFIIEIIAKSTAKIAQISHKDFKLTDKHMELLAAAFRKTSGRDMTYGEVVLPMAADLQKLMFMLSDFVKKQVSKDEIHDFLDKFRDQLSQVVADAECATINDESGIVQKNLSDLENIYKACLVEKARPSSEKTSTLSGDKVSPRIAMIKDQVATSKKALSDTSDFGKKSIKFINEMNSAEIYPSMRPLVNETISAINTIIASSAKRIVTNQKAFSLELRIYTSFLNDTVKTSPANESFTGDTDHVLYDIVLEAKLTKSERDAIKDEDFGLPKQRKYPLIDRVRIQDAISFFHFCKEADRKELADNIMKKISELKLDIKIGEKSMIRKYITVTE